MFKSSRTRTYVEAAAFQLWSFQRRSERTVDTIGNSSDALASWIIVSPSYRPSVPFHTTLT